MGREPRCIITDQDPSMKVAIPQVFTTTCHRFCMWHIMSKFESAMDSQRHKSAQLTKASESSIPEYKTPLHIERYASSIYNLSIFYLVQKEICCACYSCAVQSLQHEGIVFTYVISDERGLNFTLVHNTSDGTTLCSCKHFERIGILCRHIFFVLKDKKVNAIPDRYVLRRWCKDSILKPLNAFEDGVFKQCVGTEEQTLAMKTLWSDIHFCVGMIEHHPHLLQQFSDVIKVQKELLSSSQPSSAAASSKSEVIKGFYGSPIPTQISVHPPQQARNKGCGKRIKSGKEKAIEVSKKSKRLCRKCNQKGYHDSRNCPLNLEE
ncbi:unnamed protein product [Cuscuta europaea]|uniref:SWIM-type domain-containing protein n=1 Tax=Cuscuta europaea TaxID=41803 RepID=A0A9P0YTP0_CUSEU|nr:unnamed protein product [Cuscuta europaea]